MTLDYYSAQEIRVWLETHISEKELAQAYATAGNAFLWFADDIYDYEEGSSEYQKACKIIDEWCELYEELTLQLF